MESLKAIFVSGIFCLLRILLVSGREDYAPRVKAAAYEMRDAIHQVGYTYPSWPLPENSYSNSPVAQSMQSTTLNREKEVTTLDRFYRVSPDGTVEFKIVLSDGQINYQKIYNKAVNGRGIIQVYVGYYSVRLDDGRYRTTYYIADEMGYRLLGYDVGKEPPVEWRGNEKDKVIT